MAEARWDASAVEVSAGARIGGFDVLRPIATGGMGVVYEARQRSPERRVALKMMRTGLTSPSAERRFRYEAEVLGRLRHPGIAQVYESGVHAPDAGVAGTPYLALEYVEGARDVLTWVRERDLGRTERLQLFVTICEAVHHGHQNGVIHRDIKPANLLVDDEGRAKVIDFGVARAVDPGERQTLATRTGEIVGTLQYMSPEQLAGDPYLVDLRSDVYALGVVLYEMLCGALPYDVDGKSIVEVARTVQETPPRSPRALAQDLPVELEWVLLRALEKEPGRRYRSAADLVADVRRFLDHEPVDAGPPSATYRLRKFVRRNRLLVGAGTSVVVALVAGFVVATAGYVEAATEAAKFRTINGVLVDTLSSVVPERDGVDARVADLLDQTATRLLENADESPEVRASLHHTLGTSFYRLAQYEKAEEQQRRALALLDGRVGRGDRERLATVLGLVRALTAREEWDEARRELDDAILVASRSLGETDELTLSMRSHAAWIVYLQGGYRAAIEQFEVLLGESRAARGEEDATTLSILARLARASVDAQEYAAAEQRYRHLIEIQERISGEESYELISRRLSLAGVLVTANELDEAEAILETQLPRLIELTGEEHPSARIGLQNLGHLYMTRGEFAKAESLFHDSLEILERTFGPDHAQTLVAKSNLAQAMEQLGNHAKTVEMLREVVASRTAGWGPEHPRTIAAENELALTLMNNGRNDLATALIQHVYDVRRRDLPEDDALTLEAAANLGYLHYRMLAFGEALPFFRHAYEGRKRRFGLEDDLSLRYGNNVLVVYGRLGRYDEAAALATELFPAQRAFLAPDDPNLLSVMANLGQLHQLRGDLAQAEEAFRAALAHADEHHPPRLTGRLSAMGNLAECLHERGKSEEAVDLFQELFALWDRPQDRRQKELYVENRTMFGYCLRDLGRYEEAVLEMEVAYEITREIELGPGAETRKRARDLIDLYELWGRPQDAEPWRAVLAEPVKGDKDD